jgi:hypothetical protein
VESEAEQRIEALEAHVARLDAELRELRDEREIHAALLRYVRGLDRSDPELIGQAFHPDAFADHGFVTFTGREIGPVVADLLRDSTACVHFIASELIEVEGDEAHSEAYFLDTFEADRDGQTFLFWRIARYIDRWERRDGTWKIAYRVVTDCWNRVDAVTERWPFVDRFHPSRKSREDPVYTIRDVKRALEFEAARNRAPAENLDSLLAERGFVRQASD